ncbi:MAG: cupin domain-containing protein [Verrucomicrobia bacterium]|nr:cupin domain-containing protein [Verrucomicrobiota bacterium]
MKKVHAPTLPEEFYTSPKGKFASGYREISVALGRVPESLDLALRHPFDVEFSRLPAGKILCPFHSHSAQWEFYYVLSGRGQVRDDEGLHEIEAGDAFLFKPDEAHQLLNPYETDLVFLTIADNPIGESCYYPDSRKWLVRSPNRALIRSESLDYFDGEEEVG